MNRQIWKLGTAILGVFALLLCFSGAVHAEETAPERNTVEVYTVDEFLDAIAPNTEIVLATGEYNLTKATNYSRGGGRYYHWEGCFDGSELVITDVENLSIVGGDPMAVTISTEPRYANVLRFDNVDGLEISNLVVGHTREQGYCTGGVLYFEDSKNIQIDASRLYGCGTLGVSLYSCRNVHVNGSDIYDCSYGCIEVSNSENVLFENSKFFDCNIVLEGFAVRTSQNVAIINSEIYNNQGGDFSTLFYADSPDLYLGGLDIHDNGVETIFGGNGAAVTVESCRFNTYGKWAEGEICAVSPDGTELTSGDLSTMKMRTVSWKPVQLPEAPKVEAGEDGKIHVTNVDEFLAAIGPDTTIFLEPGEYNLTQAANYGGLGSEHYYWESCYDGYELVILDASGLCIEAESPEKVSIVTEPRYANVLRFDALTGLVVRNVKVGHTVDAGVCSGGVIQLNNVNKSLIEGCKLYGCGILGVQGIYCNNLSIFNCEIYECSSGAASFHLCNTVRVEQCNVHDIGQGEPDVYVFYADSGCTDVQVDGEPIVVGPA